MVRGIFIKIQMLMKILRFLQNFLKISRMFCENLRTNQNSAVVGGSGGRSPPEPEENFKIFQFKPNEKLQFNMC